MGITETTVKDNFVLKLLSLNAKEIEELLAFLFQKMHYRVEGTIREEDLLYIHLVNRAENKTERALACWTGGKRILALDFLQSFLKTPPFNGEASFEKGFFLSPYEFASDFQEEATKNGIVLINGEKLSELLIQNELTYYFPSFLQALGKLLWQKLPFILAPLLLLYGFFMYQTLKPHPSVISVESPPQVGTTTAPSPPSSRNPEVSLVNPSFEVPFEKPNEIYKRMDTLPGPPASPRIKPPATEVPVPNRVEIPETPPTIEPPPPQTAPPPVRAVRTPRPTPRTTAPANAFRIINKHSKVVDLEQKYYFIARELEKNHFNAKAKAYYQKYLRIAPDGDFADQARDALKRL